MLLTFFIWTENGIIIFDVDFCQLGKQSFYECHLVWGDLEKIRVVSMGLENREYFLR